MPRDRPPTTGYERLAQADNLSDSDDDLAQSSASLQPAAAPRFASITAQPRHRSGMISPKAGNHRPKLRKRRGSSGGVDIKAINARLERWADEIASKFKRGRGKSISGEEERLEIHHSVFQPPEGVRPITSEGLAEDQPGAMTKAEFEAIVDSVRVAIRQEVHPSMISQGSSGSYFARNPDGKIVGVFKPKDEEPYAAGNPKWNKWIHRNLFPCCFGRACLIPNLSYVSEAAAYVLDSQLRTQLVPYTDVVWLSSKSFHYPFWDRRSFYRKKKPLPPKPGSFQVFLKGFKDANVFLREHPWPDQYWSGFRANDTHRSRKKRWTESCRPSTSGSPEDADSSEDETAEPVEYSAGPPRFSWTEQIKQSFREELEKLVILDYIMRNTDRGLDNWMVKVDWEAGKVSVVSDPVHLNMKTPLDDEEESGPRPVQAEQMPPSATSASYPYRVQRPMNPSSNKTVSQEPAISIGAIDNSLSWPWKHPDAWRSFPFGWLFLPVDLIGRPFSQKTRDHFLPLLTSTAWWAQTQMALKKVFQADEDFQERMFAKQIAVMKGQAWNVVEALKTPDHGPLELTRRAKVCVWDDLVDVPVAVPMRVTSSELRRNSNFRHSMDEADIASSATVVQDPTADLLGFPSAPVDMPRSARFDEVSSPNEDGARSPNERRSMNGTERNALGNHAASRSLNVYEPARHGPHQQRRYSFASPAAVRSNSNSLAQQLYGDSQESYDGDDLDGDLGYAAAEGQMGNQRKVIVERLEAVKSRNPVFTWC
ncbi:Phosphatidylinositol 4-kinase LSB6 [Conoideocrella luteorostrata]|uniref:Phosphatidylinositol 4-kinase n=1 Tax=Conoideocrella luteorostrata TaxID=1105319 RepID=A0AAJ0FTK7_9HYPO|nr:Phosphatidylinositol 4-kinase LSB6 [Conoideocrella luteorostrata]